MDTISGSVRSFSGSFLNAKRLQCTGFTASTFTSGVVIASQTTIQTLSADTLVAGSVTAFNVVHGVSETLAAVYSMGASIGTHAPGSFSVGTISGIYDGYSMVFYGLRSHATLTAAAGMTLRFVANGKIISRTWNGNTFNTGSATTQSAISEGVPVNGFVKNNYMGSVTTQTYNPAVISFTEGPYSALGTPMFNAVRVGPSGTVIWASTTVANITSASLTLYFLAIPSLTVYG